MIFIALLVGFVFGVCLTVYITGERCSEELPSCPDYIPAWMEDAGSTA